MIGAGVRSVRFGSMGSMGRWLAVLAWAGATACGSGGSGEAWVPDPFVPTASMSALHVDGNRIVDEHGTTVVLKGLALADPDQVSRDGHWNTEYFDQARSWARAWSGSPFTHSSGGRAAPRRTWRSWIRG